MQPNPISYVLWMQIGQQLRKFIQIRMLWYILYVSSAGVIAGRKKVRPDRATYAQVKSRKYLHPRIAY